MGLSYTHTFPMPPSLNGLFSTNFRTGRRFKSKAYGNWEKAVAKYGGNKPAIPLSGQLRAVYRLGKPSNRKMDLANREKATTDLLVRWGVMRDDSQICDLHMMWDKNTPQGMVSVLIEEI